MISDLSFNKKSLLMAEFSNLAYTNHAKFAGYSSVFLNTKGTQAYFIWDDTDVVIICRGTEPKELSDIIADIQFDLVPSSAKIGLVHHGFKKSVDRVWDDLVSLLETYGKDKQIWCTGHSLGAAMATLIATRCHRLDNMPNPVLFTFGSPRVGDKIYARLMEGLEIEHHRWVNNADIVTRNPIPPYFHYGTLHYFDHHGNLAVLNRWQTFKDRAKGFFVGIKKGKVNFFVNHLMENYLTNLKKLK